MPIKCPIDGYTLVWNDEFDGTALNTSDWAYDTGSHGWGNNKTIATAQTEFHTYGMEWTSQKMDFYIDGVKFFTYKNDGKGHDSWPFDAAFYPILNLAWGGNWGGAQGIDESALPAVYEIDYVRIFQK